MHSLGRCSPGLNFYPRPPRGGRPASIVLRQTASNFYPRPPRGGRPKRFATPGSNNIKFLSTPSARRATFFSWRMTSMSMRFLSTPSARRATKSWHSSSWLLSYFYPRPPRGGRLLNNSLHTDPLTISIHALREEGDVFIVGVAVVIPTISIHALREEGDIVDSTQI